MNKKFINDMIHSGLMRDPNSYPAQELKDLNPNIPKWFIDDYTNFRDGKKLQSDYEVQPLKMLKIEDLDL